MNIKRDERPTGTRATHYSHAKEGPFRCDRCIHYLSTQGKTLCQHSEVVADPEMKKLKIDGTNYAIVEPGGCCEEFRKIPIEDTLFIKVGL